MPGDGIFWLLPPEVVIVPAEFMIRPLQTPFGLLAGFQAAVVIPVIIHLVVGLASPAYAKRHANPYQSTVLYTIILTLRSKLIWSSSDTGDNPNQYRTHSCNPPC